MTRPGDPAPGAPGDPLAHDPLAHDPPAYDPATGDPLGGALRDARFLDAASRPLRLMAHDVQDLQVIAALAQDAVFPASETAWRPRSRRFALLLNRFRWEEPDRRPPERVRSVLVIGEVMGVASDGIERGRDPVLSLLSIGFEPGPDGTGHVFLTLAGDGAIRVAVEALDVHLRDVTRPYAAPSGRVPRHA